MGDPRKIRKKYSTPAHPWEGDRIKEEKELIRDYGLKNKKEVWKFTSKIRKINQQIKKIIREKNEQSRKEEEQLLNKLIKYGIINEDAKIEDVLGLDVRRLMDRRLQTLVYKKKLSLSLKQARQFIVHGHITVNGRKVTIPSYMVLKGEENTIQFKPTSKLSKEDNAERIIIQKKNEEGKQ